MITTRARLTGERPQQGVTPDSLLALHDAGYRAVADRLGPGRVLDVGCGRGFASLQLAGEGRRVVGVDRSAEATVAAARLGATVAGGVPANGSQAGPARMAVGRLAVGRMDGLALGLATGTFESVCSSHLVEHFEHPEAHVAEVARVLADGGTAFFLTPNGPTDFENPFHVHLFDRSGLADLLGRWFSDVWLGGIDATDHVKADIAARRARGARLLALDVFDLRHKLPRGWYVAAYTALLPVAYRLLARGGADGATGITAGDWFVTDAVDDTTLVLFAVCRLPRRQPATAPAAA